MAFPGDLLGYRAVLCQDPHGSSAEVLQPSRVCFIATRILRGLLTDYPELGQGLLRQALADLDRTEADYVALLTRGLRERFLQLLVMLYERHGRELGESGHALDLPISRKDIADLLGATAEAISRLTSRLEAEGLIRFDGRTVLFDTLSNLETAAQPQH